MTTGEKLDQLLKEFAELVPPKVKGAGEELRRCAKAGTEPLLKKLNLVSRDEYDIQLALVRSLREKLREMQAQLDKLEAENKGKTND